MSNKTTSDFVAELADALEGQRCELFSNRSGTSLDVGMVGKVAQFIAVWMNEHGWTVIHSTNYTKEADELYALYEEL